MSTATLSSNFPSIKQLPAARAVLCMRRRSALVAVQIGMRAVAGCNVECKQIDGAGLGHCMAEHVPKAPRRGYSIPSSSGRYDDAGAYWTCVRRKLRRGVVGQPGGAGQSPCVMGAQRREPPTSRPHHYSTQPLITRRVSKQRSLKQDSHPS